MKPVMKQLRIIHDELRNLSWTCNSGDNLVIRTCMKIRERAHQARNFGDKILGLKKFISRIPCPMFPIFIPEKIYHKYLP